MIVVIVILGFLTGITRVVLGGSEAAVGISNTLFYVVTIITILLYVPGTVGLGIRRFHDMNLSAWWMLLYLVPIVGNFLPFFLLFIRGTAGPNGYGERMSPRDFDRVLFGPRPKDSTSALVQQPLAQPTGTPSENSPSR